MIRNAFERCYVVAAVCWRNRSGAVALLFALAAVPVLAATGITLDYGRATSTRTKLQIILDETVLEAVKRPASDQVADALAIFQTKMFNSGDDPATASFQIPSAGVLSGFVEYRLPATLTQLFGIQSVPISVKAAASLEGASSGTLASMSGPCILVLDETAVQAFVVNGGADVRAPNCEVHVRSNAAASSIFNAGSRLDVAKICLRGTNIIDNGGWHPNLILGCPALSNPFVGKLPPQPSTACTFSDNSYNSGAVSLTPGVYCGWHNFGSGVDVDLAPGVYVIKGGGWNVDGGKWSGHGVTFYFEDTSKIQFNTGIESDLSAPTSGTYKGILMYEKDGLPRSPFVLDDAKGSALEGLIYLPSRDTIFNSESKVTSEKLYMIFNTLILDQTNWSLGTVTTDVAATASNASLASGIPRLVN